MIVKFKGINVFIPDELIDCLGIEVVNYGEHEEGASDCHEPEYFDFDDDDMTFEMPGEEEGKKFLSDPDIEVNPGLREYFAEESKTGFGYSWVLEEHEGKTFEDDEVYQECLGMYAWTFVEEIKSGNADLCIDIPEDNTLVSVVKKPGIQCEDLWKPGKFEPSEEFINAVKESL